MTAELVAKRHIFKVTCGTAVSGAPHTLQWPKHNALKIQPYEEGGGATLQNEHASRGRT